MSTGDAALPAVATLLPPTTASDSTMSSPLSEVKDAYADDLDDHHHIHERPANNDASDSTSNLSDVDPPESEAETDRLFDSPQKPAHRKDILIDHNNEAKVFERSPSKLQQELRPAKDTVMSSPLDSPVAAALNADPMSPSPVHSKDPESPTRVPTVSKPTESASQDSNTDKRKRKRSPEPVDSDSDEPLRKRTSLDGQSSTRGETSTASTANSGEQSGADDEGSIPRRKRNEPEAKKTSHQSHQTAPPEPKPKKSKRLSARKRKSPTNTENTDGDQAQEFPDEEAAQAGDEDITPTVEEDAMDIDGDNEAGIAHKNEEELEKKKMAFDQLAAIEKHFTAFRDRLYEERLEQLNKEEAMLRGDAPSHPEYLAMMQCVDARLQEKLRFAENHHKHNMDSLNKWAVGRRAQIMSQFHQGARASRERILSDLGKQWYEIQHERRRHANSAPDFGIRYPAQRGKQIRNAVAYNKEVSILSGVAKYQGFPAAPELNGAASSEMDDDFEAIARARQPAPSVVQHFHHDYGVSNRSLGPAGEQFLEQTPWANPNHPSHQLASRHQAGPPGPEARPETQFSRRPPATSCQQNPFAMHGSIQGLSNGQSGPKSKPESSTAAKRDGKGAGEGGRSRKNSDMAVQAEAVASAG